METIRAFGRQALYVGDWIAIALAIPFLFAMAASLLIVMFHPAGASEDIRFGLWFWSLVLLLWIAPGYRFWPTRPGVRYERKPRNWAYVLGLLCFFGAVVFAII